MTFSVLLPTRNRLEYLRYAVESVRRQDDGDWELVVSDNDSQEDIAGFVTALGDPRVVYVRTPTAVPVTENWNNALRHSTGDYVVMLGDDDGLLPGYLARVRSLVERWDSPDAIYTNALLLTYPGVDPLRPEGFLQPYGYAPFFRGAHGPRLLTAEERRRLVVSAMRFRVRYGFNMQFVVVRRSTADRLSGNGDFFRSPFPDYYAMNRLMLEADRVVMSPEPGVVVGVTPKSYGFFHANQQEGTAKAFLGSVDDTGAEARLKNEILPGTNINTGWLLALEALRADAGGGAPDLVPDLRRYRRLQALYVYQHHLLGDTVGAADFEALRARLGRVERTVYDAGFGVARLLRSHVPPRLRSAAAYAFALAQRQTPHYVPEPDPRSFSTLTDVLDSFKADPEPVCPNCGARARPWRRLRDRNRRLSDVAFAYVRCRACRLIFLPEVPADLDRYYPDSYYQLPGSRDELTAGAREHEAYKIELLAPVKPGGRLVEIGPAIGGFSALAQDAGYAVQAIEMDERAAAFLEGTVGIPTANTADIAAALAERGPFDVIALWHVIEHLHDPFSALADVAAALAPGGVIILGAPNPDAFQLRVLGRAWTHLDAPRHLFLIPMPVIEARAAALGLEVCLATTVDAGGLMWNSFGWRETLAHSVRSVKGGHALRAVGSVLARVAAPIEHRGRRGTAYTLILRRPD